MKRPLFVAAALLLLSAVTLSTERAGAPPFDTGDVYAASRPGNLSPVVRDFPDRVYVPNSGLNTVDVIDPHTFTIVGHIKVGRQPQHVTPSYDLKTLWVLNDLGDSLTRIDPATGQKLDTVNVKDPYNLYYTPDGRYAIVVAERTRRLDFRDAQTMKLVDPVAVPCRGVDHMDFSADGSYLIASCEFSGDLIKMDVRTHRLLATLRLSRHAMPQDVRLAPDGRIFYVADMAGSGVFQIDGEALKPIRFIATGKGAHGLNFSRDSKWLYVSNRNEGTVALIDLRTGTLATKWTIPGGGSPDMGGVSADGKVLWISGRYHAEVYAFDTADGHLLARIRVGKGPHGLCVYPQPGRYSLGHTGILR
jgi:YVTN family beta-propeller protein